MAIERVAVIGAGTMGAGIAQVCAQAGWTTALYDAFPEGLERGMQRIDAFWDKGIARGKTTAEQKEAWAKNLRAEADMKTAVHDVDLVIEAVPEIPELKAKGIESLTKEMFEHFGESVAELINLDESVADCLNAPENKAAFDLLRESLGEGLGVIVVSGHIGNWELMAQAFSAAVFPVSSVAKPTYDPRLTALVDEFRGRNGMKTLDKYLLMRD